MIFLKTPLKCSDHILERERVFEFEFAQYYSGGCVTICTFYVFYDIFEEIEKLRNWCCFIFEFDDNDKDKNRDATDGYKELLSV